MDKQFRPRPGCSNGIEAFRRFVFAVQRVEPEQRAIHIIQTGTKSSATVSRIECRKTTLCRVITRVQQLEREMGNDVAVAAENSTSENMIERKNSRYQMLREYRDRMWRGFEKFGMNPVDARRLPLLSKTKSPRERLEEVLRCGKP